MCANVERNNWCSSFGQIGYEMELDKNVGDYASAIVRDADLLIADTANMNAEQQQSIDGLKREAVRFLTFYRDNNISHGLIDF